MSRTPSTSPSSSGRSRAAGMPRRTARRGSNGTPRRAGGASRRTRAARSSSARATASRHSGRRTRGAPAGEQRGDLRHHAPLVGLAPAFGHREVDAVGVGLEQRNAAGGEFAAHQRERLAAAPRHLVGRVHVREARQAAARGEVSVRRVHDQLHGRRHRLVGVALRRARRRRARARLGGEPLLDQPIDQREQRAEPVARRADPVRAHQRRVQAGDVGLDDALCHAGGEQVQRRAAVRRAIAGLVRGQRRSRTQVSAHQQRIDHAGSRPGIGEPLVAPRRHLRQRERRAAEHAREPGDLVDVRGGVAAHARGIALRTPRESGRRECARGPARRCRDGAPPL